MINNNLFTPTQRCPVTSNKVHILTPFPTLKVAGMKRKMGECIHTESLVFIESAKLHRALLTRFQMFL